MGGRGIAAAGGLGLRQSAAAFEAPGIKQSGRRLPQSKAASPRAADGTSAFHDRTLSPKVTIMFLGEDGCHTRFSIGT
jgi:hypothetical protein